jgi:hypothetical protein
MLSYSVVLSSTFDLISRADTVQRTGMPRAVMVMCRTMICGGMTILRFCCIFLLLSIPALARAPQPLEDGNTSSPYYGYQFGSTKSDYSTSIWTDLIGNTFLAGNTNSSLFQFQSGTQDIFLSKHDSSNGSLLWGFQVGSSLPDSAVDISSLNNENITTDIFMTGYTTGKLFEKMNSTIRYVEYNSDARDSSSHEIILCPGERLIATTDSYYWATSSGDIFFTLENPFRDWVYSDSVRCSGMTLIYDYPSASCELLNLIFECYSSHCTATTALIITQPNSEETLVDGFISRHSSDTGEMLWQVQFGTTSCDVPYAVHISPWDNGVYVVGGTRGSLYADLVGSQSVFIGKFNSSNGDLVWGYQDGGSSYASSVVCDEHGGVYVLGYTNPTSSSSYFDPPWDSISRSIITMKLSSDGVLIWGKQYGVTNENDFATAMAIGSNESLFVSGYNNHPGYSFLFKLNSSTGEKIWRIKENKKFSWSMSIMNSSVFVASTILRQEKNKYQLSRYDGDTGKRLWGLNYASIPTDYALPSFLQRAAVSINQNNLIRVTGSVSYNLYAKEVYGEVDFMILSPNICPAGYYSPSYTAAACEICFSLEGSHKCTDCPHGFLSSSGSSTCNVECYGGYFSNSHSICFHTDQHLFYYLFGLIIPIYVLTLILLALSWVNIGFAYTSLVSTFDFLSDILYLTTTFFYNDTLFYASLLLLLPAFLPLLSDLCLKISENNHTLRLLLSS